MYFIIKKAVCKERGANKNPPRHIRLSPLVLEIRFANSWESAARISKGPLVQRGLLRSRWGIVKLSMIGNNPSVGFADSSLCTREPFDLVGTASQLQHKGA